MPMIRNTMSSIRIVLPTMSVLPIEKSFRFTFLPITQT